MPEPGQRHPRDTQVAPLRVGGPGRWEGEGNTQHQGVWEGQVGGRGRATPNTRACGRATG